MSQNLLISFSELINEGDASWDAIYTETQGLGSLLKWIDFEEGFHTGPLEVTVRSPYLTYFFERDFAFLTKITSFTSLSDIGGVRWCDETVDLYLKGIDALIWRVTFEDFYSADVINFVRAKRIEGISK